MAKKPTTTKSIENDVAAELEKALDLDLAGDEGGLDMAASMEDLEAQISAAADELAREGRILSLQLEIDDRPGLLAKIATLVGEAGGNILEVSHNRMMIDASAKSARLGMVVEARDAVHAAEIKAVLTRAGYPPLAH